jgi:hypothetical protein
MTHSQVLCVDSLARTAIPGPFRFCRVNAMVASLARECYSKRSPTNERRDGCGDHTINARVLGRGVRTVHDEIGAAVGFRLYG